MSNALMLDHRLVYYKYANFVPKPEDEEQIY